MAATTTVAAERLELLLTALASEPALGGALVLDADPALVEPLTAWFARQVGGPDGPAPRLILGAGARDEDIWAAPRPDPRPPHHWRLGPGPLVAAELAPGPAPVVVVPDLARLGVAGLRAALQIVGAEETVVEHAGVSRRFRPRSRWLVLCETAALTTVPRHVRERFALRASAVGITPEQVAALARRPPRDDGTARPCPAVTDEAVRHLTRRLGAAVTPRRLLTAARLARVLARFDAADRAGPPHARRAADAMGLPGLPTPERQDTPGPRPYMPPALPRRTHRPRQPGPDGDRPATATARVHPPSELRTLPSAPLPHWEPYPDTAPGGDTEAPDGGPSRLRLPHGRCAGAGRQPGRGPSTGLLQARSLRDVSVVGTVLQAARFRPLRSPRGGPLVVRPQDLREHLRPPLPDRLLALLLDHTAREGPDWTPHLEPFLRWAYTRRAELLVVEVGAATAATELRAEALGLRGVLHPALAPVLRRRPGRATPLAHGMALLVRHLRRHAAAVTEVLAVAATDGRANVPLAASLRNRAPDRPVGSEAVRDAHAQAALLGSQDPTRFRPFVLAPPGHGGRTLVQDLADRMGAVVLPATRAEEAAP
ncbi:hypothetical protein [Streptomyces sp. NPDC002644]